MHYTTKFNFGRNKLFCHGWCRKEQKLERRSWSDLPLDIINLIADRLYYVYQIRFQAVWQESGSSRYRPIRRQIAMVDGYNAHSCYLYEKYPVFNSARNRTIFVGATPLDSKNDWVLFQGNNKVSRRREKVLHSFSIHLSLIRSINFLYCASTGFTKQTSQRLQFLQTCVVFAISLESNKYIINICRLEDITWN